MKNNLELFEDRLNAVIRQQQRLSKEILELKNDFLHLKEVSQARGKIAADIKTEQQERVVKTEVLQTEKKPKQKEKEKSNLEKFIGENLINKIGIIVTIIGVAIGVKYSIDNQLISPLVRIILGYAAGLGLLGFGFRLKRKYENYSAVLVSGSIAILYFITYAAYSFYGLIPQIPAFICMLVFTAFTVFGSVHYNRQIIAHIGLVGAYAIPFLLSENSGNATVLFTYMAIINLGILIIAYKKYWKPLYFSSFALTWLIFCSWYFMNYSDNRFVPAMVFLCIFFLTFYCMFLVYKLVRKETYSKTDIVPLLINSFIFYGIGYGMIATRTVDNQWLGFFTLINALVHSVVSFIIYQQKLTDRKLLYFTIGLVIAFITITIPVLLDGNWVTLFWLAEACLLFCIGRIKNISVHEKIAYPVIFLAFFSLLQDWIRVYWRYTDFQPIWNIHFLTSILAVVAFAVITYFYFNRKYPAISFNQKIYGNILKISIPAMLMVVLYNSFQLEIAHYWEQLYRNTRGMEGEYAFSYTLKYYKYIWMLDYSLGFVIVLFLVNQLKIRNRKFGLGSIILSQVFMLLFLTAGLFILSELRESYLDGDLTSISDVLIIRYISFIFAAVVLFLLYIQVDLEFMQPVSNKLKIMVEYSVNIFALWILSSELIHWLDIAGYPETYKLGLSILWGVYALLMVTLGIWKNRRHLRIGGIILLGVTLLKVCLYDLSELNTISRTIIFVALGVLLLIVSFLYNKYKHRIFEENK